MRAHRIWRAFGYGEIDALRLERIAAALVREGATDDITIARRAIAAITWRPLAEEMNRRNRPEQGHLEATLHALDHDARVEQATVPALIDYHGHGVMVTPQDAALLDGDELMHGNAFIIRNADGTGRRIDPTTVRVDHLEGALYSEGDEVEAVPPPLHHAQPCSPDAIARHAEHLQLDAERDDERNEVELGPEMCEHGLYVWMPCSRCADDEELPPIPHGARTRFEQPDTLGDEAIDEAHSAIQAYTVTHGVRPDTLAVGPPEPRHRGQHLEQLFVIPVVVDDKVKPGIIELLVDTLVWVKPNANPIHGQVLANSHEYVLVLARAGDRLNEDGIRRPHAESTRARFGRGWTNHRGVKGFPDTKARKTTRGVPNPLGARPRSYVEFYVGSEKGNKHPAPMALGLAEHLVKLATFPGQSVLDPFAGSCTTARAARKHGRSCIAIEKNPEYAHHAAARLQQQALLAEPAA